MHISDHGADIAAAYMLSSQSHSRTVARCIVQFRLEQGFVHGSGPSWPSCLVDMGSSGAFGSAGALYTSAGLSSWECSIASDESSVSGDLRSGFNLKFCREASCSIELTLSTILDDSADKATCELVDMSDGQRLRYFSSKHERVDLGGV